MLVILLVILWQAQDFPVLKRDAPQYPPLAKAARIGGTVVLEYKIGGNGEPTELRLVSGHPLLAPGAQANLRTWRFDASGERVGSRRTVDYIFAFSGTPNDGSQDTSKVEVSFEGSRTVRITSATPIDSTIQRTGCPDGKIEPPSEPIVSSDFVSLSRSGCYGTCPSYQVKVHANGNVEWEGGSFVKDRGKTRWSVAGPAASALVQRFRLTDVWSLCDDFSQSITDNAAVQIEIHVGSRLKRITDYANSSPLWFQGLIRLIDEVADTHRARHGSPKSEPFANIEHEYLPKPDMTDLMKAAGRGDGAQVRAILKTGGDLQAVDASGWSALMFAATHDDGSLVEMLLSAGGEFPASVRDRVIFEA